jgi:hypothetical protein
MDKVPIGWLVATVHVAQPGPTKVWLELRVTGRMRSDHSGSVRRLAGCNYGGSGGRVLIMAAMVAARLN